MLARKAFCPITTACCSGVICEIVTGVALIVFFSLSAICQGVCLRPGRMGHPGRRCLRCDRGFLRYQKESLVSSRAPARVPHPRPEPVEGGIGGRNVGARVGMLAMSSRAPALFAGERDLSERFLGPTENVGPRNDNGADHPGHGSVECQRTEVTDPPSPTNRVGEDGAPGRATRARGG